MTPNKLMMQLSKHLCLHYQHDFGLWHRGTSIIFLFPVGFSVYFAVIASKNLQKSSAMQNISGVSLNEVKNFVFGDHSGFCL